MATYVAFHLSLESLLRQEGEMCCVYGGQDIYILLHGLED